VVLSAATGCYSVCDWLDGLSQPGCGFKYTFKAVEAAIKDGHLDLTEYCEFLNEDFI
jgi:hypothetical protein